MQQELIIYRRYSLVCHQSSVICRLCSTSVENPLQIAPFYAKQTQFTKCPNLYKCLSYKDIYNFCQSDKSQKQTQFKPNQTQFKKSQNERKCLYHK